MKIHMIKTGMFSIAIACFATANAAETALARDNGAPVGDNQNSYTAGENGGVLLQDVQLIQKLQRFARKRIPERVVHARGVGIHGEFVASRDISNLSKASVFEKHPVLATHNLNTQFWPPTSVLATHNLTSSVLATHHQFWPPII